jgi:hypothetical protein
MQLSICRRYLLGVVRLTLMLLLDDVDDVE